MLDDIRADLHACVAHEDPIHDPTNREVELRLHKDGL